MVMLGMGALLAGCLVAQEPGREAYAGKVRPLLERYCYDCHGDGAKKGGLALDRHGSYRESLADRKLWKKASLFLQSHVMPPIGKPKPSPAERKAIRDWIEDAVFHVDPDRPDPGHLTLRRLNRAEYNNSVRDVFGISSRPADAFPPDDSGYGFDNVGDVLALSPMLMEKYLGAASEVVKEATTPGPIGKVGALIPGRDLLVVAGKPEIRDPVVVLAGERDRVAFDADVPAEGAYRVSLRAAAKADGSERPQIRVLCDGREIAALEIRSKWTGAIKRFGPARERVILPGGRHRITYVAAPGTSVAAIYQAELHGPYTPVLARPTPFLEAELGRDAVLDDPRLLMSGEDLEAGEGKSSLDTGKSWFAGNGYRHVRFDTLREGRYRLRVRAGAQQAGGEPVRFEIRIAGKRFGPFEVTANAQQPAWMDVEAELPAGSQDMQVWFVNEYADEQSGAKRLLWVHELAVEGPIGARRTLDADGVAPILRRVGHRLYRRPLSGEEAKRLTVLAQRAQAAGAPPMDALRAGLTALLVSPHFLYWNAPKPAGAEERGVVPIDESALASRLSAFLWSSVPDTELLKAAETGKLRSSLGRQVERMVSDPKISALTRNFAGQWLQLRDMDIVSPDPKRFPGFNRELATSMRRESELLFDHILKENRPVGEFITADYSFLNERLARHYGIEGVEGDRYRKVSMETTGRRGVLTHASLLTLTSHPTRTSPVKRGKYILERILGTPPPPAPANVPPLEEVEKAAPGASFREQMELHRTNRGCAACHAYLDPMGFALEHFDAVGRYRTRVNGRPVDASGKLVTGEAFKDFGELQRLLAGNGLRTFVRAFAEQLLTYGLGRGVTYRDKLVVEEIVNRAMASGAGFRVMILAVCESIPFQKMRGPGWKEER